MAGTILEAVNRFRCLHRGGSQELAADGLRKQQAYLASLPEPQDDAERSYRQYQCQTASHRSSWRGHILDFAARLVTWVLLLRDDPDPACPKGGGEGTEKRAVFLRQGVTLSIVPSSLTAEYRIDEMPYMGPRRLTAEDRRFFRDMVWDRYRKDGLFCLKLLLRMEMYAYARMQGPYCAVLTHTEYSYASSFLTAYCRYHGMEHINVMHGEKLYSIQDSFVHFDRFYVWDAFYRDLFVSLRAEPAQFRVELPPSMQPWRADGVEKSVDYTYYLQAEDRAMLEKIAQALHTLQARGMVIAVRPHPRYTSPEAMRFFQHFLVEDCSISIEQSILRTKRAVSRYSTVLLQASINGVSVVVDDLTAPERFAQLAELKYIMLSLPHTLLSEELRRVSQPQP